MTVWLSPVGFEQSLASALGSTIAERWACVFEMHILFRLSVRKL